MLRNRRLGGYKFRRQEPIGPFVVDFFCYEARVVIEVDGAQHFEAANAARDKARSAYLEALGLRVLRFNNREVLTETEAVAETILRALTRSPSP